MKNKEQKQEIKTYYINKASNNKKCHISNSGIFSNSDKKTRRQKIYKELSWTRVKNQATKKQRTANNALPKVRAGHSNIGCSCLVLK